MDITVTQEKICSKLKQIKSRKNGISTISTTTEYTQKYVLLTL